MAKFRSWNEEFKRFVYFEDGGYYYFTARFSDGIIVKVRLSDDDKYKEFNWQNAEQSTGKFDKKGNEVFENDIGVIYFTEDRIIDGIEEYYEFKGIVNLCVIEGIYIERQKGGRYHLRDYITADNFQFEIIGNIHEGENK